MGLRLSGIHCTKKDAQMQRGIVREAAFEKLPRFPAAAEKLATRNTFAISESDFSAIFRPAIQRARP
jgi:hypothetical protein